VQELQLFTVYLLFRYALYPMRFAGTVFSVVQMLWNNGYEQVEVFF
jgi:hypothetical protein